MGSNKNPLIKFNCDMCGKESHTRPSHFKRKTKHFCSMGCYAMFRKEKMVFSEQNPYKGVRKAGESKQVYHRNYCKSNPINIAHLKSLRYARERNAVGHHSLIEWLDLMSKHEYKCSICQETKRLTKDHIIPLSKGGTNFISNIQPLCKNCNSKKHNKIIYQNPELVS